MGKINRDSRAWNAFVGFGSLIVGVVVLYLTSGWPFAVGWFLLLLVLTVYNIMKTRRERSAKPDDPSGLASS
jgi:membrane protein implicated in regulation of membrane protease activity